MQEAPGLSEQLRGGQRHPKYLANRRLQTTPPARVLAAPPAGRALGPAGKVNQHVHLVAYDNLCSLLVPHAGDGNDTIKRRCKPPAIVVVAGR